MRVAVSGPPKWKSITKRNPEGSSLAKKWLSVQLDLAVSKGHVEAATSLQLGLDTFFAALCKSKGIPYTVFLSWENQDDLWDEEARATFTDLVQSAADVRLVSIGSYQEGCIRLQSEAITQWLREEESTLLLVKNKSLGKAQTERKKILEGSSKLFTFKI